MAERYPEEIKGFRVLGHDPSAAWGCGSLVQVHKGYAYVCSVGTSSGHAPEGFTAHDVRDPTNPKKVFEFRAPPGVHCHKLRVLGDHILWVNSERLAGDRGRNARAGIFIFDIRRQLAFLPNDAPGWNKRVIWTLDVKNPLKPDVIGIWGLPWQKAEGEGQGGDPMPHEDAITLHGPPMIRGNRMYAAFWGGGIAIIDCTDLAKMELVGHLQWSPPFPGSTHTAWPLGDRPYLIVTDEARAKQKFWDAQFMWVVDIRTETNPIPVATFFPEREKYFDRPGRFGAHNILEDIH